MSDVFIDDYRAVHMAAQNMLACARRGAWIEVSAIATEIAKATRLLSTSETVKQLTSDDQSERTRILKSLVQIDYEISALRDPQSQNLDRLLGG